MGRDRYRGTAEVKRLLAFLVLAGAGFWLLYELVGDDFIIASGESDDENLPDDTDRGVQVEISEGSFAATAEQRGELRLPRTREIRQPDGSIRKQTVFTLHALDSRPVRDGRQQLDDVTATMFEDGERAAEIRARQAFVELGRDQNGKLTIDAHKEIELHEVDFAALPGSKLEGLSLQVERAQALIDDHEVHLYTPSADVPVTITFVGERAATLVGKGLSARLPRDREGALQRVDVNILSEPELRTAGVVARAKGLLHYAENTAREVAELSLTEAVVVELDGGFDAGAPKSAATADGVGDRAARGRMTIRADQMLGWLARGSARQPDGTVRETTSWRMLQLSGGPAQVELPEVLVTTPQLTVLPGIFGMPFWVTASGGISNIEQRGPTAVAQDGTSAGDGNLLRGSSPRRIHLLRGREQTGAIHRAFGFPQWATAPLDGFHGVLFEGESHLEDSQRVVDSKDGLHVFQTDRNQDGVAARGFGKVTMTEKATATSEALHAIGNDGFLLTATAERKELDLGPPRRRDGSGGDRWRGHRYEIRHGELTATGTGSCRLEREGEFAVVELRSPDRDIRAQIAGRDADLTDVRWLRAEFEGETIRTFALAGMPARATFVRGNEEFSIRAPRIEQTSAWSMRLLPPDPEDTELWPDLPDSARLPTLTRTVTAGPSTGREELVATAPRIDLHYVGTERVLVDARAVADQLAHATATVARQPGAEPVAIEFTAERLRALPGLLTEAVKRAHLGGRRDHVGMLPFFAENGPWILGDGVRSVEVEDPVEGRFEGKAHALVMSVAAEAALLLGDPATLTPATATRTVPGRIVTARGAQVRILRRDTARMQAFRAFPGRSAQLLPEIELHQEGRSDAFSHILAQCRGDIELVPDAVEFHGPVIASSINADGSTSPDGPGIVAQTLTMNLHSKTGEILSVIGQDVDLDWSRVRGHAAEIELTPKRKRLIARDPDGVSAVLADGTRVGGRSVMIDYHTLAVRAFDGHVNR